MHCTYRLQRPIAHAHPARRHDHPHDERRDGLDATVTVRMVFVGGPASDEHANENRR